jgi:hypothetical protein
VEERTFVDDVRKRFCDDLHDSFLCRLPTLLHKFLIDKGVGHIVKYKPTLRMLINSDWKIKQGE